MANDEELKKGTRLVVVDDADFTRKSIVGILTSEGYNVVGEANCAKDAIKMLGTVNSNLFIIDVVMPDSSGIELAETLLEQFEHTSEKVFIIMISSLRMENIIIDAISKGASDFILKPFTKDDILKSVEKIALQIQANNNKLVK